MSSSKPAAQATLPTDVTEEEAAQGFVLLTVPNPRGSMAREVATVPAVVRPRAKGAPGDYAVKMLMPSAKIEYAIKNAHDRVIMDAESTPEAVARKYPLEAISMRGPVRFSLAALLVSAGLIATLSEAPRVAHADPLPLAPQIALLATPPDGTETELLFASLDTSVPVAVASFSHLPYAVVRGATLPGTSRVVVIADMLPRRDRSWASALVRLEPAQAPIVLATELARGSRPVLDGAGGALVERGLAGDAPSADDVKHPLRLDALAVERVDTDTGAATTLYSGNGYLAHVAGVLDGEAFVYRVGPPGADLVAVHLATKQLRVVVPSWPPMARDFSVDAGTHSLIVQQTEVSGDRKNVLLRVDAKTGSRTVLAESAQRDFAAFVLPTGGVAFTPEGADRTRVLGSGPEIPIAPGGFFWGRAASPDGAVALGLLVPARGLPEPVVVSMNDGATRSVPHPAGTRAEVAGFVGSAP